MSSFETAVITFHAVCAGHAYAKARVDSTHRNVKPPFNSMYRLQFTPEFGFADAAILVDYFSGLGISAIYASPIFESRRLSSHGYDVTNHSRVREELGGERSLRRLIDALQDNGIVWVQDIVPNHMAFDPANEILTDVLIHGRKSVYRNFFDIEWNHPNAVIRDKLIAPFFNRSVDDLIRHRQVKLCASYPMLVDIGGFKLPASSLTYSIVTGAMKGYNIPALCSIPLDELSSETDVSVSLISSLIPGGMEYAAFENAVKKINSDVNAIRRLMQLQNFVPRHWQSSRSEINYRRFFAVNDLICCRIEDEENFATVNNRLAELCRDGLFAGTRVDHIDGISEPAEYLGRLRKATGNRYIVVEKILSGNEALPHDWNAEGTTGYDFLNWSNLLLHKSDGVRRIRKFYRYLTKSRPGGDEETVSLKKEIMARYFQGDIEVISARMLSQARAAGISDYPTGTEMGEAVVEMLARIPVYRTYVALSSAEDVNENGKSRMNVAIRAAARHRPCLLPALSCIERVLQKSPLDSGCLSAVSRLQQFMPAVYAKGIEDTLFYRDIALLSVNAIGHSPDGDAMTVSAFHEKVLRRFRESPYSINATSTHDTKIGEDLRMRISVLSELPDLWIRNVIKWSARNRKFRRKANGAIAPDRNDEYRIYQAIAGSFPFTKNERRQYSRRLSAYLVKAMREASVNTSWDSPCPAYEKACIEFARRALKEFDADRSNGVSGFHERIAFRGYLKSLSLAVLKLTCPGIPDIYRGSESWNFSFVDPDNRRPADFRTLRRHMSRYRKLVDSGKQPSCSRSDFTSGFIKFYTTARLLSLRKNNQDLFVEGEYMPMKLTRNNDSFISFCRRTGKKWIAVCLPLFSYDLEFTGAPRFLPGHMKKCSLILPENHPSSVISIFGDGTEITINRGTEDTVDIADMFRSFPVAVLASEEVEGLLND
ncbi:MAG: malto-oligosyltrehalose synthase [Thermoplasmata archaeon]|nr:malto-oligosyltrehalose synthase [Candidatus Sysuiplasma jiujiangense]